MKVANLSGGHILNTKKGAMSEMCLVPQASVKNTYEVLSMGSQLKCCLRCAVGQNWKHIVQQQLMSPV